LLPSTFFLLFSARDVRNTRQRRYPEEGLAVPKVQEFIYISKEKADRFGAPRRRIASLSAGMGVPGAQANISVTADDHDDREMLHTRLRRAIRAARRTARCYEDDGITPGDWITFSGDFGYSILDSASFRLFLMTQTAASLRGDTALLLFGNPRNTQVGKPPAAVNVSELDSYVANLITFARDLLNVEAVEAPTAGHKEHNRSAVQLFARIAAAHHGTEHVEGLAKTTDVINGTILMMPDYCAEEDTDYLPEAELPRPTRLVVASPLYVAVAH
jgi:hypothetical protein